MRLVDEVRLVEEKGEQGSLDFVSRSGDIVISEERGSRGVAASYLNVALPNDDVQTAGQFSKALSAC